MENKNYLYPMQQRLKQSKSTAEMVAVLRANCPFYLNDLWRYGLCLQIKPCEFEKNYLPFYEAAVYHLYLKYLATLN